MNNYAKWEIGEEQRNRMIEQKIVNDYLLFWRQELKRSLIRIIFWAAIVAMGGFGILSLSMKNTYTASCAWIVKPQIESYNNENMNRILKQYSTLFKSDIIKIIGKQEFGDDVDNIINSHIETSFSDNSNVITVMASADTPYNAYKLLKVVKDSYLQIQSEAKNGFILELCEGPHDYMITETRNNNVEKLSFVFFLLIILLEILALFIYAAVKRNNIRQENIKNVNILKSNYLGKIHFSGGYKNFCTDKRGCKDIFYKDIKRLSFFVDHRMKERDSKVLLITSLFRGEGKTTVALNLSLALAQERKKVLLIDLNFQKPSIYKRMNLKSKKIIGIEQYFEGKASLDDIILQQKEENLWICAMTRKIDSTLFFKNNGLFELINEMRNKMDYIIIDTSSCDTSDEPYILAKMVDEILLVIKHNKPKTDEIIDCMDEIVRSQGRILGCALNETPRERGI